MRQLALALMLSAAGSTIGAQTQNAESETAIRGIVAQQVIAWNAGSGEAYAEHLSPDVSFTNLFGMVMYGKAAFARRHAEILATFYKGTTKPMPFAAFDSSPLMWRWWISITRIAV